MGLQSGCVEHHLSIFRPYEREAKHEDQLTRAALIVLKLVPLAHAAFLDVAQCRPLSNLPRPLFNMQTEHLVSLDVDAEDPELAELVSVFLGPHENLVGEAEPNLASERRARYDGVIQYGSELLNGSLRHPPEYSGHAIVAVGRRSCS